MKKFAFILFLSFFAMAFVACQQEATDETQAENNTTAQATAQTSAQATAETQAPRKPEFQEKAESMPKTTVSFASEEYNYGKVPTGTKVTHRFTFTNTGSEPLNLTRVKASCGCTTPSYSTEPIAPGAEGFIDVEFNTAGKTGVQNKTVTVTGNFDGSINRVLRLTGEVLSGDA